jgi:hypothetical protein
LTAVRLFQANPEVSCVDEGKDGALLYNPDKDDSVILNRTGRDIWAFLGAPHGLEEIAQHLTTTFPGVTPERAAQDAEKFIQSLLPDFIVPTTESADTALSTDYTDSTDSRSESKDPVASNPLNP